MKNFLKNNWFKVSILIVIIFLAGIAFYWFQNKKNSDESLNQQRCSDQSIKFFRNETDILKLSYTDHYNAKNNKCFILMQYNNPTDHGGGGGTHSSLYDVYGNVLYAELWQTLDYPVSCKFIFSKEKCSSKSDFDNFIKTYMND